MKRILLILIVLIFSSFAFANVCVSGVSNGVDATYFTVCINKSMYAPGETIRISAQGWGGQCENGWSMLNLTARTKSGNTATVLTTGGGVDYRIYYSNRKYGDITLPANSTPGSQVVTFVGKGTKWNYHDLPADQRTAIVNFTLPYTVNASPVINSLSISGSNNALLGGLFLKNHFGGTDAFESVTCNVNATDPDNDALHYDMNFYYRVPNGSAVLLVSRKNLSSSSSKYTLLSAVPVGARIYCSALVKDAYYTTSRKSSFTGTTWTPLYIFED
jgi:hypothetical protein